MGHTVSKEETANQVLQSPLTSPRIPAEKFRSSTSGGAAPEPGDKEGLVPLPVPVASAHLPDNWFKLRINPGVSIEEWGPLTNDLFEAEVDYDADRRITCIWLELPKELIDPGMRAAPLFDQARNEAIFVLGNADVWLWKRVPANDPKFADIEEERVLMGLDKRGNLAGFIIKNATESVSGLAEAVLSAT